MSVAAIRFIDSSNADSLGYGDADYDEDGLWVLEENGEWSADLRNLRESDVAGAKAAAEDVLGFSGKWNWLPSNHGAALELIKL